MIKTLGVGWIKNSSYGLRHKRLRKNYVDLKSFYLELKEKKIFRFPVENFARFDRISKITSIAVALALYDAGISYAKGKLLDIGILGTSLTGATDAGLVYFKDYLAAGRTLGRANLFIYTLASSPLAEAAIHFGLAGPLLYVGLAKNSHSELLKYAKDMISYGYVKNILAVEASNKEAICYVIGSFTKNENKAHLP